MNDDVIRARKFLDENKLDCLIINSTNEFLVEYNDLAENSRYNLTGFSGSVGDALLTRDKLYLFVDGRYHIQADNEVDKNVIKVVKLETGQNFLDEVCNYIKQDDIVGIFSRKTSLARYEKLSKKLSNIVFLENDPFSILNRKPMEDNVEVKQSITGFSVDEKLNKLKSKLKPDEALLVTNSEEVSYIFNLRNFTQPFSSKIKAKAVITTHEAKLFTVEHMTNYEDYLREFEGKFIVDKSSINLYDWLIVEDKFFAADENIISEMKSVKNAAELKHYKKCFEHTDKTMYAIREFIENNNDITEYDISKKLEEYFYKFGAKSLSFRSIVAIDKNSALAHYSNTDKNVKLKDGGLVLIDCGAYYEGGYATDITRVFVKGKPTDLQKRVYTTVLKMFLTAFNYQLTKETTGFEIDISARKIGDENKIDGFVFNHGLGHGIGISVHEYPPNLSSNELAKVKIKDNMCFTIEPGLYNKEFFGVRLENSCYKKDGKIHSFTDMCYEKKLIDYSILNDKEKKQLKGFKVL